LTTRVLLWKDGPGTLKVIHVAVQMKKLSRRLPFTFISLFVISSLVFLISLRSSQISQPVSSPPPPSIQPPFPPAPDLLPQLRDPTCNRSLTRLIPVSTTSSSRSPHYLHLSGNPPGLLVVHSENHDTGTAAVSVCGLFISSSLDILESGGWW
jgi:hypothetical protein